MIKKISFKENKIAKITVFFISIIIGFVIIDQYNAYQKLHIIASERDGSRDIFDQIYILINNNKQLKEEISTLKEELNNLDDIENISVAIKEEITKLKKIAGHMDIEGPGITIKIQNIIDGIWFIDMVNEYYTAGANAISINDIRLIDKNSGFTFTNGSTILNGKNISPPYTIKIIGDPQVLLKSLNQPGGIIDRLKKYYPLNNISIQRSQIIKMRKIY